MNPSRTAIRNVLVLVAVIGAFYLGTLRPGESWDDDFAMYVHEAKNIALGLNYSQTGYIYQTQYAKLGPRTYPPGFPLLLAGVYKVFGLNLTAMKVEMVVLFLASLLAISLAFQRDLSTKQLLALVAMIGFNPYFWNFKEQIVSDIPFLLLAYFALFLIHRYEQGRFNADWSAALTGLAMFAAYSTRTVGICLLAALWLRDAVRLRKLSRFTVIATLVFVPSAALESFFARAESSYADQFASAPAFFSHAIGYLKSFSVLWENGYSPAFRLFAFGLLSVLALAGFAMRLRRVEIFETFAIAYMGILLLWPPAEDRLLIPLFPIYMFYVLIGLEAAVGWAKPAQQRAAAAAVAMVICLSYAASYSRMNYGPVDGVEEAQARALFDFVATRTNPNDKFIFRRPRALALFADRSSATYFWMNSDQDVWKNFCDVRATHIIAGYLDKTTPPTGTPPGFLNDFVKQHSQDLQQVYSNPSFTVYRIERPCSVTTTER